MGKRVFLHGYFGFGNLGDEAILDGLVRELRRRDAEVEIVAASGDPGQTAKRLAIDGAIPSAGLIRRTCSRSTFESPRS